MKPLVLTSLRGLQLRASGLADLVIPFAFRFIWKPLPSPDRLASYLGPRLPEHGHVDHWSGYVGRWPPGQKDTRNLSLVEFCRTYETVELWFDPDPVDQLQLIWLLDGLGSDPETVAKLKLRPVSYDMLTATGAQLAQWQAPYFTITQADIDTASATWCAYRASTPEAFFALLRRDLSRLPMLGPVVIDLLEELPSAATGLGGTEMRLLELVAGGYARMSWPLHLPSLRRRHVFNSLETGFLFEGLALGPRPALAGLDKEIGTLGRDDYENYNERDAAYKRARLSITDFGKAVLAHEEDFSRYNPIDRWWGGTHLTNDNLWRCDPVLIPPIKQ
jgi:hypothetical protein